MNSKEIEMAEKRKYSITIEETISQDFVVFADNDDEAKKIATENYHKGEFVLEPGSLLAKQMAIHRVADGKKSEWTEF